MLALLGLAACDPTEPSEQGQWSLRIGLRDHLAGHDQPAMVLVGSRFSVDLVDRPTANGAIEVSPELAACVPMTGSGSLIVSGGEFVVNDIGSGSVEIPAPTEACPELTGELASLTADGWSLVATDMGLVVWSLWFEQALSGLSPGPAGQFPAELGRILGRNGIPDADPSSNRRVRVASGGTFQLDPVIVDDQNADAPVEIRWSGRNAELTASHEFLLQREYEDDAHPTRLFGRVDLPDPQVSELVTTSFGVPLDDNALQLGIIHWPNMPVVEVIGSEQITELELVPVYNPGDDEREWSEPVAVIAVAHDALGNRIVAPPVEWRQIEGDLAVHERRTTDVSDVFYVDDICRERPDQPQARTATIEARLGDLVASTELEWVALASGPTPTPDAEICGGRGCDCSVDADPRGSIVALFGLLVLARLRRKRFIPRS